MSQDWTDPDPSGAAPLTQDEGARLLALAHAWEGGDRASGAEIEEALGWLRPRLRRPASPREERFDVVDLGGEPLGWSAPRWLCHLTGLRHRAVHVLLTTPQGLWALQVRSHRKPHWPGHLDVSASGHLKQGQGWLEGAASELEEELGLVGVELAPLGEAYERHDPPSLPQWMHNWQVNRSFVGVLTGEALGRVRFVDGEADGLLLCAASEVARRVGLGDKVAPGLRDTFALWG